MDSVDNSNVAATAAGTTVMFGLPLIIAFFFCFLGEFKRSRAPAHSLDHRRGRRAPRGFAMGR